MGLRIDTSEVDRLASDLDALPHIVRAEAERTMDKGIQKMKEALQEDAKSSEHFSQLAPTITSDKEYGWGGTAWEIGPDKEKTTRRGVPGALGNIAYFGGANGGGASLDFVTPINSEIAVIEDRLAKILGEQL
ncbi:hypothetical protein [Brevibacterium luteolum]|uniref:HK97 gp10 family phage protein n=1 Tax=Brevibacterium luteolum TaxID=199591 RepID=A0A849AKR1_9MICO|nr:hypothetical protein [Brevibacterium luteolum]MBM7530442.1 putative pyridoxine 5'-phosphate oxidase superfamily flavin-nucleotide-binding protein [Brevibacterium luteolum]NNG77838.1 hypothetical protein [Brevibacterium luteolum]